jgi:hypothetical protein
MSAHRSIKVPKPVNIVHPLTGEPVGFTLSFRVFVDRICQNPLWTKSYRAGLAQQAIRRATGEAEDKKLEVLQLSEEDWQFFKEACENPRLVGDNGGVQEGLGFMPLFVPQVLPFQTAVIDAERIV